jgi:hypothetical protein
MLDRLDQLACRNATGCFSAVTGNAPRFFVRHRLVLCCSPNSQHRPQLLPPDPGGDAPSTSPRIRTKGLVLFGAGLRQRATVAREDGLTGPAG